MTEPPATESPEDRATFGTMAFNGLPVFVVLERALAAIEQDRPRLALDAIEAVREGFAAWPVEWPEGHGLSGEEAAAFDAQFEAFLEQLEHMARASEAL